uniref:Uncharacterized protein n=1 Tax=viral metagenome TaxID=1070528 RepID=A0A6M3J6N8_9ZZZZ
MIPIIPDGERRYKNATTAEYLDRFLDPEGGVKLYVDLTPKTYGWLIASGVAVFALGGILWHILPKLIK